MSAGYWWCQDCSEAVPPQSVTSDERHDRRAGGCGFVVSWCDGGFAPPATHPTRLEAARDDLLRVTLIYHDAATHPVIGDNYPLGVLYSAWHLACVEYLAAMEEDSGT